jgi:hypothetical protein
MNDEQTAEKTNDDLDNLILAACAKTLQPELLKAFRRKVGDLLEEAFGTEVPFQVVLPALERIGDTIGFQRIATVGNLSPDQARLVYSVILTTATVSHREEFTLPPKDKLN